MLGNELHWFCEIRTIISGARLNVATTWFFLWVVLVILLALMTSQVNPCQPQGQDSQRNCVNATFLMSQSHETYWNSACLMVNVIVF